MKVQRNGREFTLEVTADGEGVVSHADAMMLASGGSHLSDLRAVRDQEPLFGAVASDATAWRTIEAIVHDPEFLAALRGAPPGGARERLGRRRGARGPAVRRPRPDPDRGGL